VAGWLGGLDLVEPGIVDVDKWRLAGGDPVFTGEMPLYGVAARKPQTGETVGVGDDWREDETRRAKAALIDTTMPNAARVVHYLYGGQNHFEADRKAARGLLAAAPVVGTIAPAVRAFQQRVLRYLVAEAGIRQFLDIGTGLPLVGNTHEVAQSLVPECRIVYVDDDPMVLAHARALMKSAPGGAIGYVDADIGDPGAIVADARATLDFGQPVAVMLLFTLAYVKDTATAAAVVSSLVAAVPSGSYVAIYHLASDLDPTLEEAVGQWNKMMSAQRITLRSRSQVADLVAGLELVPPGLVPVSEWRPEPTDPRFEDIIPVHGVVARKP
jgi:S-adenosyl methyltransferase